MNATTNEARLAGIANTSEAAESTAGIRFAQNSLLSELPGVVFGLIPPLRWCWRFPRVVLH